MMDHRDVGRMWDENATLWTPLARAGHDIFRDYVNTPAFLEMLPDVQGLKGLDIGCGEGHNTRLIAGRGARLTAIDISGVFLKHALELEKSEPSGIRYLHASAQELPFRSESFDFVVATMSFMDAPEHELIMSEAHRVIRPGGFLQFSITHPCFQTPRWKWVYDDSGRKVAVECGAYFDPPPHEVEEWIFRDAESQGRFRVPVFRRTLSEWLNLLLDTGFRIARVCEPRADGATIERYPALADTRIIAFFLLILCRKA
ncbi:MAG: class I SAM-dependent methyltransferase [Candidatus Abyssubacteria bacterium]